MAKTISRQEWMRQVRDMVSNMDLCRYFVITRLQNGDWWVSCYHEDGTGSGKQQAEDLYARTKEYHSVMEVYLAENIAPKEGRWKYMADLNPEEVVQLLNILSYTGDVDETVYILGLDAEDPDYRGIIVAVGDSERDGLYRVAELLTLGEAIKRVSALLAMKPETVEAVYEEG